jgi:ADP-heptose:LPS heptosyltransferase
MGILPLPGDYVHDTRIISFIGKVQLVSLSLDYEDIAFHQAGAILLREFEKRGCRGSIVVSRTYAHGDIFLAVKVLESLIKKYPDNEIIFHTAPQMEPFVRYWPDVKIITDEDVLKEALRVAGVFLDLDDIPEKFEDNNPGSGLNRIEIFHHYLGISPESLCPSYYMDRNEIKSTEAYLERFSRPFIAVSPSTMRKEKSWRPERWKEFVDAIVSQTTGTIFVFDSQDILQCKNPRIVPVINKDFRVAGSIAWHMDIMVTQDSLWSHFAAALGVPQVLLASCTDGKLLSKGYPDTTVIQRDWSCVPCWYRVKQGGCIYNNYPKCLDDVGVSEVMSKVMEALSDG